MEEEEEGVAGVAGVAVAVAVAFAAAEAEVYARAAHAGRAARTARAVKSRGIGVVKAVFVQSHRLCAISPSRLASCSFMTFRDLIRAADRVGAPHLGWQLDLPLHLGNRPIVVML